MTWADVAFFVLGGVCGAAGAVIVMVQAVTIAIRKGLGG